MKNKEKYAKEIVDILLEGGHFALNEDGKIASCCDTKCMNCLFNVKQGCNVERTAWANAEYEEPKIFTDREKAFVKLFPLIKYIARSMDGDLYMFASKPEKGNFTWKAVDGYAWWIQDFMCLNFNSITWNDEEPTSREEILRS